MQTQIEQPAIQKEAGEMNWQPYWDALNLALQMPPSERTMLAQAIISSIAEYDADADLSVSEADSDEPLEFDIVAYLQQRPGSGAPPPAEEEIKQWIEEYHTEGYK